jgi:hypothetical protein
LFCSKCGAQLNEGSVFCSRCGTGVAPVADQMPGDVSPKSRLATSLLAILIGNFGAHRFYTGKIWTAVVMLLLGVVAVVCYFAYLGVLFATVTSDELEPPLFLFPIFGLTWLCGMAVGIWSLVDFIIAVTGNFKDSQGKIIRKW